MQPLAIEIEEEEKKYYTTYMTNNTIKINSSLTMMSLLSPIPHFPLIFPWIIRCNVLYVSGCFIMWQKYDSFLSS